MTDESKKSIITCNRNYTIHRADQAYVKPSQLKVGQLAIKINGSNREHGELILKTKLGPVNISNPNDHELITDEMTLSLLGPNDVFLISGR